MSFESTHTRTYTHRYAYDWLLELECWSMIGWASLANVGVWVVEWAWRKELWLFSVEKKFLLYFFSLLPSWIRRASLLAWHQHSPIQLSTHSPTLGHSNYPNLIALSTPVLSYWFKSNIDDSWGVPDLRSCHNITSWVSGRGCVFFSGQEKLNLPTRLIIFFSLSLQFTTTRFVLSRFFFSKSQISARRNRLIIALSCFLNSSFFSRRYFKWWPFHFFFLRTKNFEFDLGIEVSRPHSPPNYPSSHVAFAIG